jgi:predicted Fe-S protein YdhL (DUF1289 family)
MGCYRSADEITDWFMASAEKSADHRPRGVAGAGRQADQAA